MTSIRDIVKVSQQLLSDNSPAILTGIGVAGTITTSLLMGRAALRANDMITKERLALFMNDPKNEHEHISDYDLTTREKVELTWIEFVPPAASMMLTIAAIVGANRIGTRRTAAIAAAYSVAEKARVEYAEKVVEHIGKNKERKIRDEVQQDRMQRDSVGRQEVFATGGGQDLCYEKFTGRYFYSSMETIKHAMNKVNHEINSGVYASLSDFYDYLGLDHTGVSDELGWNGDKLMDIMFTTTTADDNRPCIAFEYRVEPIRNYFRGH